MTTTQSAMEWLLVNPHLHNIFASLGSQVGDQYVAHPNCQITLDHIMKKLCQEDRTLRTFRRAVGFSNLIKKDLLQLLIAIKDDRMIIDKTIKLFAELTTPVENLLPVDIMSKTDAGRTTVIELNWLLFSAKESFLEPKATRRILEHIKMLLDSGIDQDSANEDTLNDCILLLRNILHVSESRPISRGNATTYQNRLIWNLFSQSFDKVLINLAARQFNGKWKIGVVQLLVILYKDQQEIQLQKLLHHWSENTILSESSEDNESNTSPPDNYSRTSDPPSDSSDSVCEVNVEPEHKISKSSPTSKKIQPSSRKPYNRNQCTKKIENLERDTSKHQSTHKPDDRASNGSIKTTDSGCDTMGDTQESISTSSNDESPKRIGKPVHQKPGNMIHKQRQNKQSLSAKQKRELKMKQLQRRALNNASLSGGSILYVMNMNVMHHHNPSNEDISQILKEFTVDFLLSAYALIVEDLRHQIVDNTENLIDSSQLFWLVTYFLKFAIQLELDYASINLVLSKDVVTFFVYQGVFLCELFENIRHHTDFDMTSRLRKLHLVVTAVREVLLAINAYLNVSYITKESKQQLSQLRRDVCEMEDLRNLFVLLLRQYNPDVHCRAYLADVVCTNHILIDLIDKCPFVERPLLKQHLKQFTAVDIMKQYGNLLGYFQENGPIINDCVFTMMHHVAGDLDSLSSLFQPCIIRSLTLMYENGFQMMDDWTDLIEYTIYQFISSTKSIKTMEKPESALNENHFPLNNSKWSKEDCDALFWYFVQSNNNNDLIGSILQLYSESGVQNKTRIGLIEQLLNQDIINDTQFNELMGKELIAVVETEVSNVNLKKEVKNLKNQLLNEGMEPLIPWLQKELLKAYHAKLSLQQQAEGNAEAIPLHYLLRDEAIPLVPWNCEQYSVMQSHVFLLFLHKLGFLLPADTGNSFARMPKTWSLLTLYNLAKKLGPIPDEWIKFDNTEIQNMDNSQ